MSYTTSSAGCWSVQEFENIGSKYNRSARPFLGSQPAGAPHAVNTQYNSPVKLYSSDSATDAYSAQSAALHSGMQRSVEPRVDYKFFFINNLHTEFFSVSAIDVKNMFYVFIKV